MKILLVQNKEMFDKDLLSRDNHCTKFANIYMQQMGHLANICNEHFWGDHCTKFGDYQTKTIITFWTDNT